MGYIIKVSCAKMPSCVKAPYEKIAVLEVDPGINSVSMISTHARGVKRVVKVWDKRFAGKTSKCAARIARAEAQELCDSLNLHELNSYCGI